MRFLRQALMGAAAFASLLCAGGVARAEEESQPSQMRATSVHVYHPSVPKGTTVSGNCWTTSIATNRAGAYRCMAGNAISDPCFATSTPHVVVCEPDPAKNKPGFAMRVKGLPPSPRPSGAVIPWLVQLRDGTTCSPLTGTRPFANGVVIGYDCAPSRKPPAGSYVGLADQLRTKAPLWTARRVVYKAGANGTVIVSANWVPVTAAWR